MTSDPAAVVRALLDGRVAPGVHRWPGPLDRAAADAVRHAVAPSRWSLAPLDGRQAATRRDALVAVGAALGLPGWWGGNLDALWDGLRDLERPTVLLWTHADGLAGHDPAGLAGVLRVLGLRAEEHGDLSVLLGDLAPDVDLPVAVPLLR